MDLVVLHKSITTFWNMLLFNSRSMFPIGHHFPTEDFFPFILEFCLVGPPIFFFSKHFFMHETACGIRFSVVLSLWFL
jgi:hypothetical protein